MISCKELQEITERVGPVAASSAERVAVYKHLAQCKECGQYLEDKYLATFLARPKEQQEYFIRKVAELAIQDAADPENEIDLNA
jgi:hypothetical protein